VGFIRWEREETQRGSVCRNGFKVLTIAAQEIVMAVSNGQYGDMLFLPLASQLRLVGVEKWAGLVYTHNKDFVLNWESSDK
jgi:hypothetical protein